MSRFVVKRRVVPPDGTTLAQNSLRVSTSRALKTTTHIVWANTGTLNTFAGKLPTPQTMVVDRFNEQPKTSRPWWDQLRACARINDMVFTAAPVNFVPSSVTVSSWCSPSSCVHDLADVNVALMFLSKKVTSIPVAIDQAPLRETGLPTYSRIPQTQTQHEGGRQTHMQP